MFAISFKLPAIEYLFGDSIAGILDYARFLPADFWGFNETVLDNFDFFAKKLPFIYNHSCLRRLIPGSRNYFIYCIAPKAIYL